MTQNNLDWIPLAKFLQWVHGRHPNPDRPINAWDYLSVNGSVNPDRAKFRTMVDEMVVAGVLEGARAIVRRDNITRYIDGPRLAITDTSYPIALTQHGDKIAREQIQMLWAREKEIREIQAARAETRKRVDEANANAAELRKERKTSRRNDILFACAIIGAIFAVLSYCKPPSTTPATQKANGPATGR